ncbi:hypothetical protein [Nocardioides yefusunii]|uniref:Fibronectin type-III domain-containing protein n=1 Tax=Nocardioides yefusunii TaxID=2500546 RepID=A0ABW1QVG8_9ACTN
MAATRAAHRAATGSLLAAMTLAVLTLGSAVAGAADAPQGSSSQDSSPQGSSSQGSSSQRSALCDSYAGECRITVSGTSLGGSGDSVNAGQTLGAAAQGNRGATVDLQFFRVEFNRDGELTELVPVGEPVAHTVGGSGARLWVVADRTTSTGWGYVGLASETGNDVSQRMGVFVGYGGNMLRLLGDGYADQKPADTVLDLHVVGQVASVGYWVEYQDESGAWQPVPGQGLTAPQFVDAPANEIGHLSYTVPATLTPGRSYTFRANTQLNYAGGKLISKPAFATWTVVPSATPQAQDRGQNFDQDKGPAAPTPSAGPSAPQPSSQPSSQPSGQATPTRPEASGDSAPSAPAPSAPAPSAPAPSAPAPRAPTPTSPSAPVTAPSAVPSSAANSAPSPASGTTAPTTTAPTTTAPTATAPSSTAAGTGASASGTGPVWGEEASADLQAVAQPVDSRISGLVGVAVLLLVLAPVTWWVLSRRPGVVSAAFGARFGTTEETL